MSANNFSCQMGYKEAEEDRHRHHDHKRRRHTSNSRRLPHSGDEDSSEGEEHRHRRKKHHAFKSRRHPQSEEGESEEEDGDEDRRTHTMSSSSRRHGSRSRRSSSARRSRHEGKSDARRARVVAMPSSESEELSDDVTRKFSEEELREYLAKKAHKKALKVAKKLKAQTVSGYSNDSNPFGDSNLTEKFVWRKKIERDILQGGDLKELSLKAEKKRQRERMLEIEKVKKRREERAIEKAQHEEEMAMLARERARAEFQDWEKKEEEFHFEQSKVRAEIRLKEGRAKAIDVLSKNLNLSDDFDVEMNEPYKIFKDLTVKEMEDLHEDIKMHLELDRATPTHIEFWEAMMVVCDWEISEARKRDAVARARVRGEEPPPELVAEERDLHANVDPEVKNVLQNMSYHELVERQAQIEAQMQSGTAKVVEYWEAILKRLHIFKAKARLREIHADLLRQHLQRFQDSDTQEPHRIQHVVEQDDQVEYADQDFEGIWLEASTLKVFGYKGGN